MKNFLVVLFCLILSPLFGQVDSLQEQLIKATLEFRHSIFNNSPDHKELKALERRWRTIEPNDTISAYLVYNISYYLQVYDPPLKRIRKVTKKFAPNTALADSINESDLDMLRNNLDLLSFIFDGFMEYDFPYKVRLDTFNLKEIEFINVRPNETIADIGSGGGNHILLLSLMYPENNFVLSELGYSYVSFLQKKINRHREILFRNERFIEVVVGKKKHLNLGKRVDKIIIRNTFHHFSKKEKMLNAIPDYLNTGGKVIFIEPMQTNRTSIDNCSQKIDYQTIIEYVNASPLKIIEEKIIDNTLFLTCKMKAPRR